MKHPKLRIAAFSLLTGAFASLAPACAGQAGEYCDIFCECERCNDRADDLCHADTNAFLDEAEIYGCENQAEALIDCVINFGDCVEANFNSKTGVTPVGTPDLCNGDLVAWQLCLATSTGLGQQIGSPPPSPGGPTPEPAMLPGVELPDDVQAE